MKKYTCAPEMEIETGMGKMVRGRADGVQPLTASVDKTYILTIKSKSATDPLLLKINLNNIKKTGYTKRKCGIPLVMTELHVDTLRFDSDERLEFWVEVDAERIRSCVRMWKGTVDL